MFTQAIISRIVHAGRTVHQIQNFFQYIKNATRRIFGVQQVEIQSPNAYENPYLSIYNTECCYIYILANAENPYLYARSRAIWEAVPSWASVIMPKSYMNASKVFNFEDFAQDVARSIKAAVENPKIKKVYLNGFSIGGATLVRALVILLQEEGIDVSKIKKVDVRNTFQSLEDVLAYGPLKCLLSFPILLVTSFLDILYLRSIQICGVLMTVIIVWASALNFLLKLDFLFSFCLSYTKK